MKNRLMELRGVLNLNQEDFGGKIGLSKASISALEGGSRAVTERHIKLICSEFSVNENWLRYGTGTMFNEIGESLDSFADRHGVTSKQRELFKALMAISPVERELFVERCQNIFANHEQAAATEEEEIQRRTKQFEEEIRSEKNIPTSSASQIVNEKEGTA